MKTSKSKSKAKAKKRWRAAALAILALLIALPALYYFLPLPESKEERSRAIVEYRNMYSVSIEGEDTLYFDGFGSDSTLIGLRPASDSTGIWRYTAASWVDKYPFMPSSFGRLAIAYTPDNGIPDTDVSLEMLKTIINRQSKLAENELRILQDYEDDMEYYVRVHGVQDEGFDYISKHSTVETQKKNMKRSVLNTVYLIALMLKDGEKSISIGRKTEYRVTYFDKNGERHTEECRLLKDMRDEGYQIIQTESGKTPKGAAKQHLRRLLSDDSGMADFWTGPWGIGNSRGDSICVVPDPYQYSGEYEKGKKQGRGTITDAKNRFIAGFWTNDVLTSGVRTDSLGYYEGKLDKNGVAQGHGSYTGRDCAYYEGHWTDDKRDVFGFSLSKAKGMRVGEWKDDKYLGEKVVYTTDRIFGIDIAKYQHEEKKVVTKKVRIKSKGKKKRYKTVKQTVTNVYPIDWSRLRISYLGANNNKHVQGNTDFPVSFVYIKATEGSSITNKYYPNDYVQARKHGLKVGSYHFFSTRTSAAAQAHYFLSYAKFSSGDFPPVLDVEPTGTMIREIGGSAELIKRIQTWLDIVEKKTGVKPILYVSQNFVNKYLADAKNIKKNYLIWIARYGEYKPDVKLIYWQLTPNGRVAGIHGAVDINVFNGYSNQFEEFKDANCIK